MENENKFTVNDLPQAERPRERLLKYGPEVLSAQELLALVIGRGNKNKSVMTISHELLNKFGSVKGISEATIEELSAIKGIGSAKAAQLKASFELGRRQELDTESLDYSLTNPDLVVKAIKNSIQDKSKEHFKLLILNSRNKIVHITTISVGTLTASLVHPREVFKEAIKRNASSIILAHNHPSGDPEPSTHDKDVTLQLVETGRIMGIHVLDHIIIGKYTHFSFKENMLL